MTAEMSEAERMARVRLARSDSVGPATFRDFIENFPNATEALAALPELAKRGNRKGALRIPSEAEITREISALSAIGASLLVIGDKDYPTPLAMLDPPPPVISVMGDLSLLKRRSIALVGSRNASAAGNKMASIFARDLGQQGYVITSGLARGIDSAAHRASLASGTIAVLGGGLDVVYPEENHALQKDIGERGLLVAEMPLGTQPRANLFPRRNRLISGLSLGVVVVEAALRSGSLITARFALEQGRDVFAVPGSPLDPRTRGANSLIKQGAALVESADDILASIDPPAMKQLFEPPSPGFTPRNGTTHDAQTNADADAKSRRANFDARPDNDITDAIRQRVLTALGPTPMLKDEIIRETGLSASEVSIVLMELAISNRIERGTGDRVSLVQPD